MNDFINQYAGDGDNAIFNFTFKIPVVSVGNIELAGLRVFINNIGDAPDDRSPKLSGYSITYDDPNGAVSTGSIVLNSSLGKGKYITILSSPDRSRSAELNSSSGFSTDDLNREFTQFDSRISVIESQIDTSLNRIDFTTYIQEGNSIDNREAVLSTQGSFNRRGTDALGNPDKIVEQKYELFINEVVSDVNKVTLNVVNDSLSNAEASKAITDTPFGTMYDVTLKGFDKKNQPITENLTGYSTLHYSTASQKYANSSTSFLNQQGVLVNSSKRWASGDGIVGTSYSAKSFAVSEDVLVVDGKDRYSAYIYSRRAANAAASVGTKLITSGFKPGDAQNQDGTNDPTNKKFPLASYANGARSLIWDVKIANEFEVFKNGLVLSSDLISSPKNDVAADFSFTPPIFNSDDKPTSPAIITLVTALGPNDVLRISQGDPAPSGAFLLRNCSNAQIANDGTSLVASNTLGNVDKATGRESLGLGTSAVVNTGTANDEISTNAESLVTRNAAIAEAVATINTSIDALKSKSATRNLDNLQVGATSLPYDFNTPLSMLGHSPGLHYIAAPTRDMTSNSPAPFSGKGILEIINLVNNLYTHKLRDLTSGKEFFRMFNGTGWLHWTQSGGPAIGSLIYFSGPTAPSGYAPMNGTALTNASTNYPELLSFANSIEKEDSGFISSGPNNTIVLQDCADFIRGIGSGTRKSGSFQADAYKTHSHVYGKTNYISSTLQSGSGDNSTLSVIPAPLNLSTEPSGDPLETRPKNRSALLCIYHGNFN